MQLPLKPSPSLFLICQNLRYMFKTFYSYSRQRRPPVEFSDQEIDKKWISKKSRKSKKKFKKKLETIEEEKLGDDDEDA